MKSRKSISWFLATVSLFVKTSASWKPDLSGAMTTKGDGGKYPHDVLAHWTLLLLWLVYVSNQWSRYVMEIISA